MKVKEIARISELRASRENGPVTRQVFISSPAIERVINDRPGVSTREIAHDMGYYDDRSFSLISSRLWSMMKRHKRPLRRLKQDGHWRYYAWNYKISNTTYPADVRMGTLERLATIPETTPPPVDIEAAIREYVWDQAADPIPFKRFIDWYKGQRND